MSPRLLLAPLAWAVALISALPSLAAPIPPGPADSFVPASIGKPVASRPIGLAPVPQNPWLAPNGRSSMHNDPFSTDAYRVTGPLGRDLRVTSESYGVRECATIAFDSRGRIVGLCGAAEGFTMMLIDPASLESLAELTMPGRDPSQPKNPFTDICGGTYFFLDARDRAFATTTSSEIWEVKVRGDSLVKGRSWALANALPEGDCLVALTVDWAGRVWFFSQRGTVGTLNRRTGRVQTVRLGARRGEAIFNSVSSDATGGVFLVTTHATYRMDATRKGRPVVTWRRAYDRGSQVKPGQLSQGSGTSPTLVGRRWIAVTDNADPRMNVLVYDRRRGVKQRLHCQVPVFAAGRSATENSLVAAGRGFIVENNYGYAGVQSTTNGRSTEPGVARVVVTRGGCRLAWTNTKISAPTSVPKASLGNGLVYVYSKPERSDGIDAWYFTALDIRTGRVAWSRLTGTGMQWNNHYASIYLGPDGTAYIATVNGLVRVADG